MGFQKIAILGTGNMGKAIADGMLSSGLVKPAELVLADLQTERLQAYTQMGCQVTADAVAACRQADVWVLGVKPQSLPELMGNLHPYCEGKLVISIAAGVSISTIESALPNCSVVRVMPNTPLMVGKGVSALCRGDLVNDTERAFAEKIFSCAGSVLWCGEDLLNPMTALTSSSVAYFARLISDMCVWAEQNGFDAFDKTAVTKWVCDTAVGTAKLITDRQLNPADLVRTVASPGGTTQRALDVFDEQNLDGIVSDAMDACLHRANELSGNGNA